MSHCVGKISVISDPDVKTLRDYIYDNSYEGQFIDVEDTVEKAEEQSSFSQNVMKC